MEWKPYLATVRTVTGYETAVSFRLQRPEPKPVGQDGWQEENQRPVGFTAEISYYLPCLYSRSRGPSAVLRRARCPQRLLLQVLSSWLVQPYCEQFSIGKTVDSGT